MKDYQPIYTGIIGIYCNKILNTIVKWIPKGKWVLDFGCGKKELEKRLKENYVLNYDINPEYTEEHDYKNTLPDVIVCNHVLEHIPDYEIEIIVKDFIRMNPNHILIVGLPTESWLSKLGMILTGHSDSYKFHVTDFKSIFRILSKYYKKIKEKNIFNATILTEWIPV